MVRIAKSIKQKQDKKKKECIELCKKFIEENNLNDSKVITIIDEDRKLVDKRITGLIATNLVDFYKNKNFTVINPTQGSKGAFLALRVDSIPLAMTPLINRFDKTQFLKGLRYQENQDNHLTLSANSIAFNEGFQGRYI